MNVVSDHADTIRWLLPLWNVGGTQGDRLLAALDALEAENQQLRDALDAFFAGFDVAGYDAHLQTAEVARAALDGTA